MFGDKNILPTGDRIFIIFAFWPNCKFMKISVSSL